MRLYHWLQSVKPDVCWSINFVRQLEQGNLALLWSQWNLARVLFSFSCYSDGGGGQ